MPTWLHSSSILVRSQNNKELPMELKIRHQASRDHRTRWDGPALGRRGPSSTAWLGHSIVTAPCDTETQGTGCTLNNICFLLFISLSLSLFFCCCCCRCKLFFFFDQPFYWIIIKHIFLGLWSNSWIHVVICKDTLDIKAFFFPVWRSC